MTAAEKLELIGMRDANEVTDFYAAVRAFEISLLERALRRAAGSQKRAAKLLGLKVTTLNSKVKRFGIDTSGRQAHLDRDRKGGFFDWHYYPLRDLGHRREAVDHGL